MVVAHNVLAMNANRMLGINTKSKAKSTEKLSSGYRINRAADDAAGLAISEKMRRQIRGLTQGVNNIQDGISTTQIMDGALNEVHDILHRMTELSVKAANGTLNTDDREAIEAEMKQLRAEVDRTTDAATFNEVPLLKAGDIEFRPRSETAGKTDVIFLVDNTASMTSHIDNVVRNLSSFASGLANCNVQYGVVEYGEINAPDHKPAVVHPITSSVSELKNTMGSISTNGGDDENESALEAIMDAVNGYSFRAGATTEFILVTDAPYHDKNIDNESSYENNDIRQKLAEKGIRLSVATIPRYANHYKNTLANGSILNIEDNFAESIEGLAKKIAEGAGELFYKNPQDLRIQMSSEVNDYFTIHTFDVSTEKLGIANVSCQTQEAAEEGIEKIKKASAKLSLIRSWIGADQNALEHAYKLRENVAENTTTAESRIRDTDMAKEMVAFSNLNVLEQAGQAMLAQANQSKQGILSLLQ